MTFPVREHFYLECDKDVDLISTKCTVETSDDRRDRICNSRLRPSPFVVQNCDQSMFKWHCKYLKPDYKNVCPFPTTPVKELFVTENHLNEIFYRDNYNGKFQSCTVRKRIPKNRTQQHNELQPLYNGVLAINSKKYNTEFVSAAVNLHIILLICVMLIRMELMMNIIMTVFMIWSDEI